MAEAWGGNVRNWRGGVAAWVQSETSTTATIRVVARWQSLAWGFNVPNGNTACVSCDGQSSGWVGVGGVYAGSGQTITKDMLVRDFIVAKHYGSGRNVGCYGGFHLGGYQVGDSGANCNVWIGGKPYSKPNTPKDFSAWLVNNGAADMSWRGDYTGMDGAYPWSNVHIDRRTDEGGWQRVADIGWDATSWRDVGIVAGHRYDYRICATGPGGQSDWVESPQYVYTTPSAPASVQASRVSDSQARLTWQNTAESVVSRKNNLVERRVDEGGWVQIATLGASTTNYTDNGISANHRYQYRVRAYNGQYSSYSTSGYIYTTPAAPRSVSISKIGGTRVRITVDSASPYADGFLYQLSVNGGGWTAEKEMGTSIDVDAGGGSVKARVRSKRGDMRSGYRESGSVTTIVPPNAPTLGEFGSVYAIPTTVRVTWTRLHPDGTEQTAAQVEVTAPNGDVKTTDVATDNFLDIKLDAEGEYRVRVRTKGLDPSWGAWSPQGSLHAEYAPQAFFTTPSIDGFVVQGVPFLVEWEIETSSGVSSQEIRLLSDSGDVLHAAQLPAEARSYSFSVDTYLPKTMSKYTVVVVASDGYSLTAEARRRVKTDYAEPAIPYIKVVYDHSDLSAHITVMQGEGGWVVNERGMLVSPEYWDGSTDHIPVNAGFEESAILGCLAIGTVVPTVRLSVVRLLDDGYQEMLTDDLPSGHEVIDRLPPLNVDYTYLVTAYSAAGTATTAEVVAHIDSDGSEAFNFGVDASRSILLGLDADASSGTSHSGEWFEFINGVGSSSLPAFYPDGGMSSSGSHSYIVTTADEYRELDAMRRDRSNAVCWFRDHWGGRHRVKADWTLGYSAKSYGTWNVSASLTEAMWEGPRNG